MKKKKITLNELKQLVKHIIKEEKESKKKTYYYCNYDTNGQRTGNYESIELYPYEIEYIDELPYQKNTDRFLYDDLQQVQRASWS